jgi:putative methyltransferase (TIGR04325 family)
MHPAIRSIALGAIQLPGLRRAISPLYTQYFDRAAGNRRLFRGLYPDFVAAANAIPKNCAVGYDNSTSATRVAHARHFRSSYDYPILFWLARILRPHSVIFDWGGNVGNSYYAFNRYLSYPDGLKWVINDVPAVLALGRQIAAEEEITGLLFTTAFDELTNADVLLSAGALQFIEDPFAILRLAVSLPVHVLLNKIPVYDLPHMVTIQNMGTSFCPYHLFNRTEIVQGFEDFGYQMVDTWQNPSLSCFIPFYPEYSITTFSGFYFRNANPRS